MFPSSRSQGTVATPKTFPTGLLLAGIAVLLVLWGLGAFFLAARRHTEVAAQPSAAPAAPAPAAPEGMLPIPEPAPASAPSMPAPPPAPVPTPTPIQLPSASPQAPIAEDVATPKDACSRAIAEAGIRLPEDFEILAAGAYGGRQLGYPMGRNGHRATQIDVLVNRPGKPIALMLGAYEPTVWNLNLVAGTRIVAVYVGGYERQQFGGLGSNVPMLLSSYEQKSPCPYFYLGGESGDINRAARRVFGRSVDMSYPAGKDGSVYIGTSAQTPLPDKARSKPLPATGAYVPGAKNPYPGEEGLQYSMRVGQIRQAGPDDADLWAQVTALQRRQRDEPPVFGQPDPTPPPPPSNVYIVQSPDFVFPDGLYGAHAVIFVVPPGIPRPQGNPGHSAVYQLR